MSDRETGQIREEAALSEAVHAPRTSLAGAEIRRARPKTDFDDGCTVHFFPPVIVFTFEAGLIKNVDWYRDAADARRASGLA